MSAVERSFLRIHDLEFEVAGCDVAAFESESRLCWTLMVAGEELEVGGDVWRPRATCRFLVTDGVEGPWAAGLPRRVTPSREPPRPDAGPTAMLHVFAHLPVRKNILEFGAWGGAEVPFSWSGRCDVRRGSYGTDLSLESRGTATFRGVLNGQLSEAEGRARLGRFIDLSIFDYVVGERGLSRFVPRGLDR